VVLRLRRRRRPNGVPLILSIAGVTALAAGAAVSVARRRRRSRRGPESWTCDCGERYLVQGTDRHRVYMRADMEPPEVLLERDCVSCGSTLPARHEAAVMRVG
jgi:hypothetical protein